jgi:hypothetical protein
MKQTVTGVTGIQLFGKSKRSSVALLSFFDFEFFKL